MPETAPAPATATGELTAWADALDAMERHLNELRAGLEHGAPMPPPYVVHTPPGKLPAALADRARSISVAQKDLEIALRERVSLLGAALHRPPANENAVSFYVDRRA